MKESDIRARLGSVLGSTVRRAVLPVGFSIAFAACAYGAPFDDDAGRVRDVAATDGTADDTRDTAESDGDTDARDSTEVAPSVERLAEAQ